MAENGKATVAATITVMEAADILGIGRNQAYEGVKSGQIPAILIGKRILVPRAALQRMLDQAGVPGKAA